MKNDRITFIYQLICEKNKVYVNEIAEALNVSPVSIRRDLLEMEQMNLVKRFYGGAILNQSVEHEPNMNAKHLVNMEAKRDVARYAASLIQNNDIVYLDAGTTTEQMIDFICAKNILVVTQALSIIEKLYRKQIRCYTYGGYVKFSTNIIIDGNTTERISELNFNNSFLGCNAINSIIGFSTTNELEAMLKAKIISLSKNAYILADSSKFDTLSDIPFAKIGEVTIITDSLKPDFDYTPYGKVICCPSNYRK